MVWPMRMRHRPPKHAFEEALDEARLTPDEDLEDLVGSAFANAMAAPSVGSLGEIAVASGYVGAASLARVYGPEREPAEPQTVVGPGEAAAKLKLDIAAGSLSAAALKLTRRRFAAQYHPDRMAPELRQEAVQAMADVNAEIDRAIAKLQRR